MPSPAARRPDTSASPCCWSRRNAIPAATRDRARSAQPADEIVRPRWGRRGLGERCGHGLEAYASTGEVPRASRAPTATPPRRAISADVLRPWRPGRLHRHRGRFRGRAGGRRRRPRSSDSPLLLVDAEHAFPLPRQAELTRLKPQRIYVLGGGASISSMRSPLRSMRTPPGPVTRLSGAESLRHRRRRRRAPSGSKSRAYVATGLTFADALAGGAVAGKVGRSGPARGRRRRCRSTTGQEILRLGSRTG